MPCSFWRLKFLLLSCHNWITSLLSLFFFRNVRPCMIYRCYMGISHWWYLCNGVMNNDWQCCNETQSLLWAIDKWLFYLARAGIENDSHDPLCTYIGVLSTGEPYSHLSLLSVWRSIYRTPNRVSPSSEVTKRIILEGNGNGCKC